MRFNSEYKLSKASRMCAVPEDRSNMSVIRLLPDGFSSYSEMNGLHGAYLLHIHYTLSHSACVGFGIKLIVP